MPDTTQRTANRTVRSIAFTPLVFIGFGAALSVSVGGHTPCTDQQQIELALRCVQVIDVRHALPTQTAGGGGRITLGIRCRRRHWFVVVFGRKCTQCAALSQNASLQWLCGAIKKTGKKSNQCLVCAALRLFARSAKVPFAEVANGSTELLYVCRRVRHLKQGRQRHVRERQHITHCATTVRTIQRRYRGSGGGVFLEASDELTQTTSSEERKKRLLHLAEARSSEKTRPDRQSDPPHSQTTSALLLFLRHCPEIAGRTRTRGTLSIERT
jgi:hypothetical protein